MLQWSCFSTHFLQYTDGNLTQIVISFEEKKKSGLTSFVMCLDVFKWIFGGNHSQCLCAH